MSWILAAALWAGGCVEGPEGAPGPVLNGEEPSVEAAGLPARLAHRNDLKALGLRAYWQIDLKMLPGDRITSAKLIDQDLVLMTERNMCYTIDVARGTERVLAQVAPGNRITEPTYDGVRYYFGGQIEAVGVNPVSGLTEVRVKLDLPCSTPAVSDKTYLYTGAFTGEVFAYSLASAVVNWKDKVGPGVSSLGLSRGQLIVCRSDIRRSEAELFAVRPRFWERNWENPIEGVVTAPIVCTNDAIFVASEDHSLYCFDAESGLLGWRCRTPGVLRDPPVLLADKIVQIVPDTGTWLISRKDGSRLHDDPARLEYMGQAEDRMYLFDGRSIVAKQADSWRTLGTAPVTAVGKILVAPNPDKDRMFLVSTSGQVLCCNDLGQPFLTIDQFRVKQP